MKEIDARKVFGQLEAREKAIINLKYLECLGHEGLDYISINGIQITECSKELFELVKSAVMNKIEKDIREADEKMTKFGIKILED